MSPFTSGGRCARPIFGMEVRGRDSKSIALTIRTGSGSTRYCANAPSAIQKTESRISLPEDFTIAFMLLTNGSNHLITKYELPSAVQYF